MAGRQVVRVVVRRLRIMLICQGVNPLHLSAAGRLFARLGQAAVLRLSARSRANARFVLVSAVVTRAGMYF